MSKKLQLKIVTPEKLILEELVDSVTIPTTEGEITILPDHIPLIASITIFMIGIFGFILRNSVIKQILAYCMFENGIHLSLALMAYNSPEIAELGILTDAIFAVIIMSVLAERFYKYFGSLDVSKATELKG